jgi:uncharacterized protein YkwD
MLLSILLMMSSALMAADVAPANGGPLPAPSGPKYETKLDPQDEKLLTPAAKAVMDLVNQERQKQGLASLEFDPHCARAARDHAVDTGKNRLRGHVGSDGSQLQDRYQRYSNQFSLLAENWAYIQDPSGQKLTPRSLMASWMNSANHRGNILDPKAKKIGVGLYRIGVELYAVQCFSAP